ncbi:putative glycerophosphocholine phosphodiesterase Gde1 [Halenospora varia]|nr:putative glycerophosphocholine phosphodiesterase Gde1 [Halenospora varia]
MYGSRKSMHELVPQLGTMHNDSSEAKDTCLHRFVFYMGQNASHQRRNQMVDVEASGTTPKVGAEDSLSLFRDLLDLLLPNQRQILLRQDTFGRSPLHYAAQYGLVKVCRIILQRIQDWKTLNGTTVAHATLLPDSEEYTPLHMAVIHGHTRTVRTLLEFLRLEDVTAQTIIEMELFTTLAKLTGIALRSNFTEIAKLLLATGKVDLNYQAENGETAVFIAARCGRADYVKILLKAPGTRELDLNLSETGYGWTPLIVACVHGHLSVVDLLLEARANERLCDAFGWTARDHTAFRGFWPIGKLLAATSPENSARIPKIQLLETNALSPCRVGETRIFVNLGTLNTREPKLAVDMNPYLSKLPYNLYPETGFSVRISANGATGSTDLIRLPILNDTTNYPYLFTTTDLGSVQLIFSVFKASIESREENKHIGGAVALLSELKSGLGPARESLIRNYTIPVLDKYSLEPIGAITFDFLVVKPFPDPSAHPVAPREIWDRAGRTQVIGHRGLGQNHPSFGRLQIGENTIQSFLATMGLGVSYIECDVQLTRDHVPVIYHDFLLSESGADLAPHQLSFDQFMHINDIQTARSVAEALTENIDLSKLPVELSRSPQSRSRAHSLDPTTDLRSRSLLERMKLTHEFRLKGFKGNIRGEHIHGPFTTLEEMLRRLPEPLGIDIELKYPMLWEAEDWEMDTYGVELNLFVDTILQKVYNFGGRRKIIFTSFSPELCVLLAHKQNRYPVLFLNESNLFPTGDVRASNLQEAVYFARRWNLHGVVMSSELFVMSPMLMAYVKDAGLISVSFGFLNNDAENAKIQFNNLDAIITDDVNLIAHTLRSITT